MLLTILLVGIVALIGRTIYDESLRQKTKRLFEFEKRCFHTYTENTERTIADLEAQADIRNAYLDYALRYANLHLSKPHVTVPAYEEDRCLHCFYPVFAGHADDCAWLHCRPLTSVLYPPPPSPAVDPVPDGNTILFPDAVPEPAEK